MKPLVIFGLGQIAEVAHFYFTVDARRSVAAFTVDQDYQTETVFCGCPVVPFETVAERYPPADYDFFVATGYAKLNRLREEKCAAARAKGYVLASYISSKATAWPGLVTGENCFILEDNTLQPFVEIGDNVFLWSGNHVGHHARIGANAFISSHVVVSGGVTVGRNCFIGVNATLRDHIQVGEACVIGAGAVVTRDLADKSVLVAPESVLSKVPSDRLRRI
jgi:sugar O-acyltransferase (sialic acid O-acetyltransferase NeuD family)